MAKVLVIDDEPNVLDYVCRRIERTGHSTVRAASCAEGVAAMQDKNVDVIVADIFLPDSPGPIEWLDRVAAGAAGRPFVVISGYPSQELIDYSNKAGAEALLTKPFEIVFLDDILKKLSGTAQNDR